MVRYSGMAMTRHMTPAMYNLDSRYLEHRKMESLMHRKLSVILLMISCLPAAAQDVGPRLQSLVQGNAVTISGRAHVQRSAEGTFIDVENPHLSRQISGFISFGDEPSFPMLSRLDGRTVEITGSVVLDGRALIQIYDPDQLRVKEF